jgi:hypothetical protein
LKVVVTTRLGASRKKDARAQVKRVRDSDGQLVTVRAIDTGSRTFGRDLRGVFAKNVSNARKDNKAIAGVTDRAPAKR